MWPRDCGNGGKTTGYVNIATNKQLGGGNKYCRRGKYRRQVIDEEAEGSDGCRGRCQEGVEIESINVGWTRG